MSAFTPASEVLLRHSDDFEQSRILFAGDLQDDLPARLDTAASRAHTQQFHHWQVSVAWQSSWQSGALSKASRSFTIFQIRSCIH